MLILPELTHESVRYGMENGLSYFVYSPNGHNGIKPPALNSVKVNNRKGTIEIIANGYGSVKWISSGKVISEGNIVDLNELDESYSYVRAKIFGPGESVAGTQPFGIRNPLLN